MKNVFITGLILAMFSAASYSDCVPHACSDVNIERLYPNTNGVVYVATSGDEAKLDCDAISDEYVTFNLSDPAGNAYYSTFLAAQLSNRKVGVRIVTGSQGCKIQYITHDK